MGKEKITVRYETNLDNPVSSSQEMLMSGPVDVFAVLDKFSELDSTELTEAIKNEVRNRTSIIIFVKDVRSTSETSLNNTQTYRGAYFAVKNIEELRNDDSQPIEYQEILLGTHSHENLALLEALENIDYSDIKELSRVVVNEDGSFFLLPESKGLSLPDIPESVKNNIEKLKKYKDLKLKESGWHHLDAPLAELEDTYDYLDPNSTAVGNCRQLYRALLKDDKPLKLDLFVSSAPSYVELKLEAVMVNWDLSTSIEDSFTYNPVASINQGKVLLTVVDLPFLVLKTDAIFLFDGERMLAKEDYKVIDVKENSLKLEIVQQEAGLRKLTILIATSAASNSELIDAVHTAYENNDFELHEINDGLLKNYVEGELERRPDVPTLYLTLDDEGKPKWDNRVIPSQLFYAKTKVLGYDYVTNPKNIVHGKTEDEKYLKVVFEDTNYNVSTDYPMLMVNASRAYDVSPRIPEDGSNSLYYLLPFDGGKCLYRLDDFTTSDILNVTCIIIKQASAEEITKEAFKDFVSKKDAVNILSRGTISLDDYMMKRDMISYANAYHTHSQYAFKLHNHDDRYANFHHTHPELLAIIKKIVNKEETESIEDWVQEIIDNNENQLHAVLEELGIGTDSESGGYYFEDDAIIVKDSIVEDINEKIREENIPLTELTGKVYLDTVLDYIVRFFKYDLSRADQVKLSRDITFDMSRGAIGGLDAPKVYHHGVDSVQDILEDILHPMHSAYNVKYFLTPDRVELKWYIFDSASEEYVNIDPAKLPYNKAGGKLLFKVEFYKDNKPCVFNCLNDVGSITVERAIPIIEAYQESPSDPGYYLYSDNFNFDNLVGEEFTIGWTGSERVITDQDGSDVVVEGVVYGDRYLDWEVLNPNNDTLTVQPVFAVNFPNYIIGKVPAVENVTKSMIEEDFDHYFGDSRLTYTVNQTNNDLVVYIENGVDLEPKDVKTGYNIKDAFTSYGNSISLFNNRASYECYHYKILSMGAEVDINISCTED